MKPQQQYRGFFKFLFVAASVLLVATITLYNYTCNQCVDAGGGGDEFEEGVKLIIKSE